MDIKNLTLSYLETLSSADLIALADDYGIDIPDNLNRRFIIGELLEVAQESIQLAPRTQVMNENGEIPAEDAELHPAAELEELDHRKQQVGDEPCQEEGCQHSTQPFKQHDDADDNNHSQKAAHKRIEGDLLTIHNTVFTVIRCKGNDYFQTKEQIKDILTN